MLAMKQSVDFLVDPEREFVPPLLRDEPRTGSATKNR
jgi:hypothetical protein